jgi:hypothetical protein
MGLDQNDVATSTRVIATDLIEPSSSISWLRLWLLGTDGSASWTVATRSIVLVFPHAESPHEEPGHASAGRGLRETCYILEGDVEVMPVAVFLRIGSEPKTCDWRMLPGPHSARRWS